MDQSMQKLRVLFLVFFIMIVLLVVAGESVPAPENLYPKGLTLLLGFAALADLVTGFFLRTSMLDPARETLRRNPSDPAAIRAWNSGYVLSFAIAESVAMFGFAVRLLTGSIDLAFPFYVVSATALIRWMPRRPDA